MSHFTVIRTQIVEVRALVKALEDVGFKNVEVHELAQHLYGYQGDVRAQTAEVIIRRKNIGPASNDIGFKRQKDGTFDAIISEYDRSRYTKDWLNHLTQRYAYHAVTERMAEQGFEVVEEENQQDRTIHLTVRRAVF
jgi:hypothetical protein